VTGIVPSAFINLRILSPGYLMTLLKLDYVVQLDKKKIIENEQGTVRRRLWHIRKYYLRC